MTPEGRSLLVAAGTTLVAGAVMLVPSPALVRLPFAVVLTCYLPGWALMRAVNLRSWAGLPAFVMQVSLSLALVVIGGLLLHFASAIDAYGWLALLVPLILVSCGISSLRLKDPAVSSVPSANGQHAPIRASFVSILLILAAATIAAVAAITSIRSALHQRAFSYSELWIAPVSGDNDPTVEIGLRNAETAETTYRVELLANEKLVQTWEDLKLPPGHAWTTNYERFGLGPYARTDVLVYKSGTDDRIYRRVWLAEVASIVAPSLENKSSLPLGKEQ